MSKKEARLKRREEKNQKNKDNNIRFAQSIGVSSEHLIRMPTPPNLNELPKLSVNNFDYQEYAFHWGLEYADRIGSWWWGESRDWTNEEYSGTIEYHLKPLEGNTWKSVENLTYNGSGKVRWPLNKYQHINTLDHEAQERWLEHEILGQFEELFRLRLGKEKRIWGLRVQYHFFMVWYERGHNIYKIKD